HLDRLEREGLIISEVSPEERGPRLGRPSKRYSPASRIEVTLPPRRFDLLGRIALRALSAIPGAGPALADTAYELGADVAKGTGKPGCGGIDILGELGFQPFRDGDHVRLRNCPFHELVEEDIDLVCGINLRFMEGLASGVAEDLGRPILDPGPNRCCVSFKRRDFT